MSVVLESSDGHELKVNAWNWGALHAIVAASRLFPAEVWEPKRSNGGGALDAKQVATLADFLAHRVLPGVKDGERIFGDGTVTSAPDDGTLYRGADTWRNYSLHREVLVEVIAFLGRASGPVTIH